MKRLPHRLLILAAILASLFIHACAAKTTAELQNNPHYYRYEQHISKKIEIIGASREPRLSEYVTAPAQIEIELHLNNSGRLLGTRLIRSSNNPALDQAFIDLILYSAPYPPLPDELNADSLRLRKTWQFVP